MAKAIVKKTVGKSAKPKVASSRSKLAKPAKPAKEPKPVPQPGPQAAKPASTPEVAEVVAAALLGAAAALRDPKKAREIAASVGEEIGAAAKDATGRGAAIWQLAMDVAARSVEVLGGAVGKDKAARKAKKKDKKKAKAKKTAKK